MILRTILQESGKCLTHIDFNYDLNESFIHTQIFRPTQANFRTRQM